LSFDPTAKQFRWLKACTNLSASESLGTTVRCELLALQALEDDALSRLPLLLNWACCLADICAGDMWQPGVVGEHTVEVVSGAFEIDRFGKSQGWGAKWDLVETELLEWTRKLSVLQDYAIRRALSMWWATESPATAEAFGLHGLRITDDSALPAKSILESA
jgi:hypothetical protein